MRNQAKTDFMNANKSLVIRLVESGKSSNYIKDVLNKLPSKPNNVKFTQQNIHDFRKAYHQKQKDAKGYQVNKLLTVAWNKKGLSGVVA